MDQFAFVNQASTKLQVSVSSVRPFLAHLLTLCALYRRSFPLPVGLTLFPLLSQGKPESIRSDAQNLITALLKLSGMIAAQSAPSDIGREQAMNGLQTLSALASNGMTSLLLDGPQLFPMLASYMKSPWIATGVSPIAFAVVYNLCQLNTARLDMFVDSGGISALDSYIRLALDTNINKESKDGNMQKLNLALALLYQIGSPKSGLQSKFINEGGLLLVLDHFNSAKSALVFLSSFVAMETQSTVIDVLLSHPDFANAIDTLYADESSDDDDDSDDDDGHDAKKDSSASLASDEEDRRKKEENARVLLIAQVLRNLCLLQGSSGAVLPLLARFLGHGLAIADEAISALSNLSATQPTTLDYRYAWDSSLIGMAISSAVRICRKLIHAAEGDVAAATFTRNAAGRKHVLARVFQVLRNDECLRLAGESSASGRPGFGHEKDDDDHEEDNEKDEDEDDDDDLLFLIDDAHALIELATLNKDLLEANRSWARTVSRYLSLLPPSHAWSNSKQTVDVHKCCIVQQDVVRGGGSIGSDGVDAGRVDGRKAPSASRASTSTHASTSSSESNSYFVDKEFNFDETLEGIHFNVPLRVMFRRLSNVRLDDSPSSSQLPRPGFDTIIQGEMACHAFAAVLSGLARHPIKLATMFKLPSSDQQKWSTGPITVKLHDFRVAKPDAHGKEHQEPKTITIDDRVPCYVFSKPISIWTGSSQAWLALIEKAAAKMLGGYAALEKLTIEQACELLTGGKAVKCKIPPAEQFQHVLESELSEQSIVVYTLKPQSVMQEEEEEKKKNEEKGASVATTTQQRDSSHDIFVVDSIQTMSDGPLVAAYNTAAFDMRRGWDASSGNVRTSIPVLHDTIASLYKLRLM